MQKLSSFNCLQRQNVIFSHFLYVCLYEKVKNVKSDKITQNHWIACEKHTKKTRGSIRQHVITHGIVSLFSRAERPLSD